IRLQSATIFPYTTLFRSQGLFEVVRIDHVEDVDVAGLDDQLTVKDHAVAHEVKRPKLVNDRRDPLSSGCMLKRLAVALCDEPVRSEEHTSELQSRFDLVC